ncbi:MAG: outer membrane lipid asymmetry maintenance protein MlaD [Gammaproteobacteria bacterium]
MQQTKTLDTLVGLFVASGIVALFFLSLQVSNLSTFVGVEGYVITARFENSGGLKVRAPVSVGGVRIGQVSSIDLDKTTYQSVVKMRIDNHYNTLPDDTGASILTSGLLGEQYVGLDPGGSEEFLKDGSELEITQSALVLEQLIGRFLFKDEDGDKNKDKNHAQEPL